MLPIHLNKLDKNALKQWLDTFDVILTDCDAVLWHDDAVIPQVPETINALQTLGKKIYFVTNNTERTRLDLWHKAIQMDYTIKEEQIIAPTHAIAQYLKQHLKEHEQVYVIGSPAIAKELNYLNIENIGVGPDVIEEKYLEVLEDIDTFCRHANVGAVVVGFDEHFSFAKLIKATQFLQSATCQFLCTNSDAVHKYTNYCIPGTGAILKALETCTHRKAHIMGKPNPLVCEDLIQNGTLQAERTLMIGDSPSVDVLFGKNCGFQTLLVGTGYYQWPEVERLLHNNATDCVPNYYVDSLSDLYEVLS